MPRDFLTLADVRVPTLSIVCEPRGRRERHNVERLQVQYGLDMKLPELLARLVADCPKSKPSASIYASETGGGSSRNWLPRSPI